MNKIYLQQAGKDINTTELRRLFPKTEAGEESVRQRIKLTIMEKTWGYLSALVPTGKGKYGSAMIEFSVRLLLAIIYPPKDEKPLVLIADQMGKIFNYNLIIQVKDNLSQLVDLLNSIITRIQAEKEDQVRPRWE